MNWGIIFGKTILERGKRYYDAGKVKNLKYEDGVYQAVVRGSGLYRVEIGVSGNTIHSMSCTCPYAAGGSRCKHMAAVLIAIERQRAQAKLRDSLPREPEEEEADLNEAMVPFPKQDREEPEEYSYFRLSHMTSELFFTERVCRDAQKLISEKAEVLKSVNTGYAVMYSDGRVIGNAQGEVKVKGHAYEVSLSFVQDRIREARCQVPGCHHGYSFNPYLYRSGTERTEPDLCVHQTALLYLLDDYIREYKPGDSTDLGGARLLRQFRSRRSAAGKEKVSEKKECISLEPRLENTREGYAVSFRIGMDRMYQVKNLTVLTENVRSEKEMELGVRLKMDFSRETFTEKSQAYYQWIEKAVKEERSREKMWNDTGRYGMAGMEVKGNIRLYGARWDELYSLIGEGPVEYVDSRGRTGRKSELLLRDEEWKLQAVIEKDVDEDGVFQGVRVSGKIPELIEGLHWYYGIKPPYWNRIPAEQIRELQPLYGDHSIGDLAFRVGRKHLGEFYYGMLPVLRSYGTVTEKDADEIASYLPPEASFGFYLDAEDRDVTCQVRAFYGDREVSVMDLAVRGANAIKEEFRDMARETEVLEQVREFFPGTDAQRDLFCCDADEEAIYEVLEHGIDRLLALGEVHSTDRFRRLNIRRKTRISIGVSVESDIMNLDISSEGISREELMEILRSYQARKKFHRLRNGDFLNMEEDSLEALSQLMEDLRLTPKEFVQGKMQLPMYRALYLDQMLGQNEGLYASRDIRFKKLVKEFKTVKDSDFEVPDTLRGIMRKYQTVGYKWLRTLGAYGFGGILADDMGLGKTLQMISVLLAYKKEGGDGTSLIVAPASLVFNWQEEFRRYAPELTVGLIVGTQPERAGKLRAYRDFDVLVTSYDLLKRDVAEYEDCRFVYQVLDEAQYIKNHSTAASKAVKIIHSKTRFALTGTPIENRLSELWSIFDYLMPGFLYGYDTFKKEWETPITKNRDEKATVRLKKMVSPFILRRLKQEVLKDLPDKLEETRFARLEKEQQLLYDAQVVHMRDMLKEQTDENFQKNRIQILAELTKIRQICCDPSLFLADYRGGSAKREACVDLIRSAMEGEHKMLVFSQFTSMLELLEEDLNREGIPYYKITGATPKETRIQLVRQFNEDATPVFLISLKAGGTGLNLTGADVVIHYDPWWNLAVQNQATDRAHRIGQTKVVSVYKLIVKDSIEEKILHMQEAKKNLADEILSGETGGISGMTREELLELLQG